MAGSPKIFYCAVEDPNGTEVPPWATGLTGKKFFFAAESNKAAMQLLYAHVGRHWRVEEWGNMPTSLTKAISLYFTPTGSGNNGGVTNMPNGSQFVPKAGYDITPMQCSREEQAVKTAQIAAKGKVKQSIFPSTAKQTKGVGARS